MNRQAFSIVTMLLACCVGLPVHAQSLACLIEPSQVAEIGSPVIGVLQDVPVERGQRVRKGEVVAILQAGVERRAVELAQTKMQAEAELSAAQANLELAQRKYERTDSLVKQNFLSGQALDQSKTEAQIAERTVARAKEQRRTAEREWQVAQAQLEQRMIKSPIDGVVVEKRLNAGERVDERPILRIATIDPLKVEVLVPAVHYTKFKVGLVGRVAPDLPDAATKSAKVNLIDGAIDSASNTFRVRLNLDNKDNAVPAGARCKVAFDGIDLGPASKAVKPASVSQAPLAAPRSTLN